MSLILIKLITLVSLSFWLMMCAKALYCICRLERLKPNESNSIGDRSYRSVVAVIAARDEADTIIPTIKALLEQQDSAIQVVAVDDWSTDNTGELLDNLAKRHDRLTVLRNPVLHQGWLGKTNALHQGAAGTSSEFLLFVDADSRLQRGTIAACLEKMEASGVDMIALLPRLCFKSPLECSLAPAWIYAISKHIKRSIVKPDSEDSFALGAFMLFRANSYRSIGGHESVRSAILDDVSLAKEVKRNGMRISLFLGPECVFIRQYRGLSDMFWGLVKNIAQVIDAKAGLWSYSIGMVWISAAMLASISPVIGFVFEDWMLFALGLGFYFAVVLGSFAFRRILDFHYSHIFAFPIGLPVFAAALLTSLGHRLVSGSIRWRNRTYHAYSTPLQAVTHHVYPLYSRQNACCKPSKTTNSIPKRKHA